MQASESVIELAPGHEIRVGVILSLSKSCEGQ
jgi:hypothetical protein